MLAMEKKILIMTKFKPKSTSYPRNTDVATDLCLSRLEEKLIRKRSLMTSSTILLEEKGKH